MFNKIIETFLNIKDKDVDNLEFEIRFGSFVQNKYFDCNVDISFFYRLKKMLKLQNNNKNHTFNVYIDTFYKGNNGDTFRESVFSGNERIVILKKSIKYHNEFDYDIRFNISSETDVTNNKNIKLEKKILIREKERDTFLFNCCKIDLTKVIEINPENGYKKIKFEVEFEICTKKTKETKESNTMIKEINNIIKYILQIRQDNFFVISNSEYNNVLSNYKNLTKSSFFIGAQPETLQKDNLNLFYNELYSVTQKADGERCFVYVNGTNDIYFIDTNLKITKTYGKCTKYNNVIIDGELLREDGKMHFMAFDLLIYNNIDIRGNVGFNLIKRLSILKEIVSDIQMNPLYYLCSCKKYIFKNVFLGCEILLSKQSNTGGWLQETDGLIFTPINEPYSLTKKWIKLLKWKPKELNTIDFLSVKKGLTANGKGNVWELYVQTVNEQKKMESELFDINALNLKFNPMSTNKTELVTFRTEFDDSFIDPTTLEPFKDNTVIEYRWDYTLKKFIPLKTRWDKTLNPFKQGNFSSVACSIWNNITNPVEYDILFKLKNLNNKDDIYFKNMRRYHNKVKEGLYNKYTKANSSLLELCVGKGVDIHKWAYNNVGYICGYDISDKNINECNERYKTLINNTPQCKMNADFYKLDLCLKNTHQVIASHGNSELYDTISCQFSVYNFLESQQTLDNLIKILDTNLRKDGIFMITYVNSAEVDNLFITNKCVSVSKTNLISYKEDNGNIVYFLKRDISDIPGETTFGCKLKIFLDGNNSFNETCEEYLVDSKWLINYLKERGYACIESDSFSNNKGYSFNEYEKTINSLYTYSIFQKMDHGNYAGSNLDVSFSKINSISLYKEELPGSSISSISVSRSIELDDANLFIIKKTHDIYDLLNCIEYNINTMSLPNTDIISYESISNCLNILNKKIIAVNLDNIQSTVVNEEETYYNKSCKKIYIYSHEYITNVINENYSENDQDSNKYIEKTVVNWYVALYKYNIFFPESKLELFKHVITQQQESTNEQPVESIEDNKENVQLVVESDSNKQHFKKRISKRTSPVLDSNSQNVNKQKSKSPSPILDSNSQNVKKQKSKSPSCSPVNLEKISEESKKELISMLDNKPTLEILKTFIKKINKQYSKTIKITGTKDVLIQRIKLEL